VVAGLVWGGVALVEGRPTGPPTMPPVEVCDRSALLDGPDSPPPGSVEVNPGDHLGRLTESNPPGTSFWLAPGVHTLPDGEFDQIVPKDANSYTGAPGAVLDGAGTTRYAFTGAATGVSISHLTIRGFVAPHQEGVVNHNGGDDWTIANNTIEGNWGAALMGGSGMVVRENCIRDNGQYGANVFKIGDGITDVVFERNEFTNNNVDDWEARIPGCGCSGGLKFWAVTGASITDNWIHDNRGVGLWADTNNADFLVEGNLIEGNDGVGIFYEISYNAVFRGNTLRRNVLVDGPADGFPNAAVYLSESGGDPRVAGPPVIEVTGNLFEDNYNGITLWENADRFCGSPANTSTRYCTLVVSDPAACTAGRIDRAPAYDDCRWKTQNVTVTGNEFRFDPEVTNCTACGRNSLIANWGTFPDWSPYAEERVQVAITATQGNTFSGNEYVGPWTFHLADFGAVVTFSEWQGAGFDQDSDLDDPGAG
jgi:hypothetical protein